MTAMTLPLDCEGFEARLADYLEGELPETAAAEVESHAAICAECGPLLTDLQDIRREAAALPALAPSRDLWAGIAERIDTRVVPLDAPRLGARPARRGWVRPAAAAAAIMVVTAGITHVLTRASYDPTMIATATGARPTDAPAAQRGAQRVAQAPPAPDVAASEPAPSTGGAGAEPARGAASGEARRGARGAAKVPRAAGSAATRSGSPAARLASTDPLEEAEPVYDREIVKLRAIVRERRAQLDPRTVAVLEQSIAVIDSAIAQSRAALAKDPASGFLATQLNHSLEKKVELLRTAALLPART